MKDSGVKSSRIVPGQQAQSEIRTAVELGLELGYPTRALTLGMPAPARKIPSASSERAEYVSTECGPHSCSTRSLPPEQSARVSRPRSIPNELWRIAALVALAVAPLVLATSAAAQGRREAIEALSRGQHDVALQILAELLDRDPRDHALSTLQGIALSEAGRPAEALAAYRRALQGAPDYLAALQGAAEIEFQNRDPVAQARLERVLSIHSENPTAHAMLGVLAFERQDCPTAVRHFANAGPTLAENTQVLWQYGQCAFQAGDMQAAGRTFRRLLDLEPSNSAARFNLALILFETNHHSEAIEIVDPLAAPDTPESEVLSLLADAYLSNQQIPEALETLKRAVAIYPREERHYVDLANLCMEQEAHDLGLEILDAGVRNIPQSARLHGMRGVILAQLSQFDKAEAEFARATELDPSQAPGKIGLSITLQQLGRHAEAIPILREQAAAEPNDPVVNAMLGRALLQQRELGDAGLEEARAALERAVESDPSFASAWVELGKLLTKTDQLAEAISALERAAENSPDDRQALYQLMLAYRKTGQLEKTRDLSQKLRAMVLRDQREETQQARFRLVKEAPRGE